MCHSDYLSLRLVSVSVTVCVWLFVSPSAYFVGFVEDDEGVFGICFRSHFVVVVVVVVVVEVRKEK